MKKWLKLWLMFFTLGIKNDDPPADPPADDPPADDPPGDDPADIDRDPDAGDDPPADDPPADDPPRQQTRGQKAITESRKRAQDAEAENVWLRAEAEARRPRPQSDDERLHEQEEAKLRDAKTTELERWQINSNRTIRSTRTESRNALAQAHDLADRTAFDLVCSKNKRLESVKADVDEHIKRMRAVGQNAPRESVAYYLLGQKVANAPAKKAPLPVDRGKTPGARSDVRARGGGSDREKRAARLENQPI